MVHSSAGHLSPAGMDLKSTLKIAYHIESNIVIYGLGSSFVQRGPGNCLDSEPESECGFQLPPAWAQRKMQPFVF